MAAEDEDVAAEDAAGDVVMAEASADDWVPWSQAQQPWSQAQPRPRSRPWRARGVS